MVIAFIAPPNAGKGTQAGNISKALGIPQLSSGDILRDKAKDNDALGLLLQPIMAEGKYPADDLVLSIMEQRITYSDCDRGFILDGSPRTMAQIEPWNDILKNKKMQLDHVINLVVDENILLERCTGRFNCTCCKKTYHDKFAKPLLDNECDICHSTDFTRRLDDTPEKFFSRMQDYHNLTAPMLEYYEAKGLLRQIDGVAPMDDVTKEILHFIVQ